MKRTIINVEHRLGHTHRVVARSLTALLWLAWGYLCLPFLSLLAWLAGIELFYREMLVRNDVDKLLDLLFVYAIVVGATSSVLILWARVNYLRFRNRERRRRAPDASLEEFAGDYRVPPAELAATQQRQIVTVHHSDHGHIVRISRH
ncbi:poly-beta-1,6-N-acetyl-D-glucosamine biosynthesis protein PgaD [Crenobacter cavernae]|uniref:Poly-beta-1,6-N-acetyl-D-glucosamine biosynthesis protein PgaD n=1 Tax=Crenobacter cavernae TaxID=2290923 RepID=A0A345Y3X9_9NEIS|nr:poly-beta-1,6-N-acetyl-D-glucosamine biosynthesis protein PgaD [Crenobacter cavernae]AXK38631.1 poly-beta-1,6-N-acetyl-D-glucosamine biosynthesis protein PgaD [Crenobacter cavernae]